MNKYKFKFVLLSFIFSMGVSIKATEGSSFNFNDDFLLKDISMDQDDKKIYNLVIRGENSNNPYVVISKDNNFYFPVIDFFHIINFNNYTLKDKKIEFYLGISSEKFEIDLNKKIIIFNGNTEKIFDDEYIFEKSEIYIKSDIFNKIFGKELRIDDEDYNIILNPSFMTPKQLEFYLNNTEDNLNELNSKQVLLYKNERTFFELGNLRVALDGVINNGNEDKKHDWEGRLDYQGDMFYGTITTSYDLKNGDLEDIELYYPEIIDNHSLKLGLYGEDREKGLSFRKEKGFYEDGMDYVIRERVPLGSRVVLYYNGLPIDVKYEENSEVVFENPLIREGRTYILQVNPPDGKPYSVSIKTNKDYNQQMYGKWGYDIDIRENKESSKYKTKLNAYYGVTSNLTLGFGYEQRPEEKNGDWILSKGLVGDVIYSNNVLGNPYTLKYSGKTELEDGDSYSNSFLGDIDINKLSILFENVENGKNNENKREQYLSFQYDLNNYIDLFYDYKRDIDFENNKNNTYEAGIQITNSWKRLLIDFEISQNNQNNREYDLNLYYSGFDKWITKLSNSFDEKGSYNVAFTLNNKQWSKTLDYSFQVSYSDTQKEKVTFDFTMRLDNWFELGTVVEKNGSKRFRAGIDTVVNLQEPLNRIDSLDSSKVKVITFIDKNNNNIKDEDEVFEGGVEIKMGEKTIDTNEDGVAYFYGVPNFAEYEFEVKSNRPTLDAQRNIIKVKGKGTSTINAYIPIKPMVSLIGKITPYLEDKHQVLELDRLNDIYNQVYIKIKDKDGKICDEFYSELDGKFYLSNILPGKYFVEISYFDKIVYSEEVILDYEKLGGENEIQFEIKI